MTKKTPKKSATTTTVLNIKEAYTRDVGRGIARIDYDTMDMLGISSGDIIQIRGKQTTVARALPLYPSDEGKKMLRIDGIGRKNSGCESDDTATIQKVESFTAQKVVVAPLEAIPPIDERYLADALESVAVVRGDSVIVPYFGGRLSFQIVDTTPKEPVVISQKTVMQIVDVRLESKKLKVVEFLGILVILYDEEKQYFQKTSDATMNYLVGKLMVATKGVINSSDCTSIIHTMMELEKK